MFGYQRFLVPVLFFYFTVLLTGSGSGIGASFEKGGDWGEDIALFAVEIQESHVAIETHHKGVIIVPD